MTDDAENKFRNAKLRILLKVTIYNDGFHLPKGGAVKEAVANGTVCIKLQSGLVQVLSNLHLG
jgi:hypothetical protein